MLASVRASIIIVRHWRSGQNVAKYGIGNTWGTIAKESLSEKIVCMVLVPLNAAKYIVLLVVNYNCYKTCT